METWKLLLGIPGNLVGLAIELQRDSVAMELMSVLIFCMYWVSTDIGDWLNQVLTLHFTFDVA